MAPIPTNVSTMKKALFLFFFASFASLVAAANNDLKASPGDPKKEEKKENSFSLAQGYFNLFNIFSITLPAPDTLRVKEPEALTPTYTGKK